MARPRTETNRLDRAHRRTGWLVNLLLLVLVLGVLLLAIVVWRQRQRTTGGSASTAVDPAASSAPLLLPSDVPLRLSDVEGKSRAIISV